MKKACFFKNFQKITKSILNYKLDINKKPFLISEKGVKIVFYIF